MILIPIVFTLLTFFVLPIGIVVTYFLFGRSGKPLSSGTLPALKQLYVLAPLIGTAILVLLALFLLFLGIATVIIGLVIGSISVLCITFMVLNRATFRLEDMKNLFVSLLVFLLVYLLFLSPLFVAGHIGIAGYEVSNDPVIHTIMAEYLGDHGYTAPATIANSYNEVVWINAFGVGYALGFHEVLGLLSRLLGARSYDLFSSVMAYLAGLTVFIGFFFLLWLGVRRIFVYLGSLAIGATYLNLSYLLQGFAPQISLTAFLYLSFFFAYASLVERLRFSLVLMAAISLAACLSLYGFIGLAWLGPFMSLLVIYLLFKERFSLSSIKSLSFRLAGMVLLAVAISPFSTLSVAKSLSSFNVSVLSQMGNLPGGFVSIFTLFNIWFGADYRFSSSISILKYANAILLLLPVALFVAGFFYLALNKRRVLPLLILASWIIPVGFLFLGNKPYPHGKVLQMGALFFGLVIVLGFARLIDYSLSKKGLQKIILGGTTVGILSLYLIGLSFSDYLVVRGAALTPARKLGELRYINNRFQNLKGPTLFVEAEDWGKYVLKDLDASAPMDRVYRGRAVRLKPGHIRESVNDFDSFDYRDISSFKFLIFSKGNDISLVPPNYDLRYKGRYYHVYQRDDRLSKLIEEHVALEDISSFSLDSTYVVKPRSSFNTEVLVTSQSKSLLLALRLDGAVYMEPEKWNLLGTSWYVWPENTDYIVSAGKGDAACSEVFEVPSDGKYEIRVTADAYGGLEVMIDEKSLGTIKRKPESGTYLSFGKLYLDSGRMHKIALISKSSSGTNYVSNISVVPVWSGAYPIIIKAGDKTWNSSAGFSPDLVRISFDEITGGGDKMQLSIDNPTDFVMKLDWLEVLR